MKEFKDINKLYTDQLIKVKVSAAGCTYLVSMILKSHLDVGYGKQRLGKICQSPGQVNAPLPRQHDLTTIVASAIMKYHGLKMEEVNETMRHLWNKTYQGTGALKMFGLEGPILINT